MKKKDIISILIGPLLFIGFLSIPIGTLEYQMRGAIGLLLWMLIWWIAQPVGPTVTALLPILAASIFEIGALGEVLAKYFNPTIVLLLSANILTLSWTKWGFDKRLSLAILRRTGNNPKTLISVWFILSVTISSLIANAVVAAVLFPIVLSTLDVVGIDSEDKISKSNYATASLLAVAWGSNIGFGTPLGGAMNLVAISYIEDMILKREFMYIDWILKSVPLVIFIAIPMLFMLLTMKMEFNKLPGTKEALDRQYRELGPFKRAEKIALVLFLTAFSLSILRPLFADLLPSVKPQFIFFIAAMLSFLIPGHGDERLLSWAYAQPRIKWGVFYLIAGGTALGGIITSSGVGAMIADKISPIASVSPFVAVIVFGLIAMFFSNIMTITGSMSLVQPIVITTMQGLGMNPIPFVFLSNAVGNISICLPSSGAGPAMCGGYGVDMRKMAKHGLITIPLCFLSVVVFGYLLYLIWPGFSTLR